MLDIALQHVLLNMPPETSHRLTLRLLEQTPAGALRLMSRAAGCPVPGATEAWQGLGLSFANRLGLAAGLDKDGRCISAWFALGFGFVEIGTVTPKPQPGNPEPRLFRLPAASALINRMGFNNEGAQALANRLGVYRARGGDGVVGVNIGKNKDTPIEQSADDYVKALRIVHSDASYITVNISSPNTPGLRTLQAGDAMRALLEPVFACREQIGGKPLPILVKVAPDLDEQERSDVAATLQDVGADGVIATNTTLERSAVRGLTHAEEAGGLSGAPLTDRARVCVAQLRAELPKEFPIVGVGGVMRGHDAAALLEQGADLVQVYTGFIYRGVRLLREARRALASV